MKWGNEYGRFIGSELGIYRATHRFATHSDGICACELCETRGNKWAKMDVDVDHHLRESPWSGCLLFNWSEEWIGGEKCY